MDFFLRCPTSFYNRPKVSIVKGIIRKGKNRIEEHIFDNKLRTAAMYNSIIKRIEDEKALNTIDNNVNM